MIRLIRLIRLIRFVLLCLVKLICVFLYRFDQKWLSQENFQQFSQVRLIVFLNHTSLFPGLIPFTRKKDESW